MSELRKSTTEYLMILPISLAFCVSLYMLLIALKMSGLSIYILLSYTFVYQMIYVITLLLDKRKSLVWFSSGLTLVLLLMFRDMVLTMNILVAFGGFVLSLLMQSKKISRYSFLIYALVMLIVWLMMLDITKVVTVLLMVLLLYGMIQLTGMEGRYYIGTLLLLGVITFILPAREEPIRWSFVKKSVNYVQNMVITLVNEVDYLIDGFVGEGSSFAGYTNTGKLSGTVTSSDTEQMRINGLVEGRMIYLEGSVFTGIDRNGLKDKKEIDELYNGWFVDYINCLYQAEVDGPMAACFSHVQKLDVSYTYMRTEDLIHPCNLLLLNDEQTEDLSDKKGKGYSYSLQYMEIDYASPYLISALQSLKDSELEYQSYETIVQYTRDIYHIDLTNKMSKENYDRVVSELKKGMAEEYLDTSFASDELKELTMKIVDGADSDYEKAKKIEAYLRQFMYSTDVDLRKSDNYVDEFVLDLQKGYCVHFASAMMEMLRIAGVPSRYASGFLHTVNASGKVMSSEAHAWPEAYIKGLGWVTFEPTVSKEAAETLGWNKILKEKPPEEYMEEKDYTSPYSEELAVENANNQEDASGEEGTQREGIDREMIFRFLMYILVLLGVVLVTILSFIIGQRINYRKMKARDKVIYNMEVLLKKLEKKVPKEMKLLSIYDYLKYIQDDGLRAELKKAFDIYYRIRFRGDEPEEDFIESTRGLAAKL